MKNNETYNDKCKNETKKEKRNLLKGKRESNCNVLQGSLTIYLLLHFLSCNNLTTKLTK